MTGQQDILTFYYEEVIDIWKKVYNQVVIKQLRRRQMLSSFILMESYFTAKNWKRQKLTE